MNKEVVQEYWDESSSGYSDIIREELDTHMREEWLRLVEENRPKGEHLRVLDAGCGPGFFSILMSQCGHTVNAVDFSKDMLARAKANAADYQVSDQITFELMDVSDMHFADNTFDLILSRNITWTLQNPTQVYREWLRVLKPGGCFINFDANWNKRYYDEGLERLVQEDIAKLRSMGFKVEDDKGDAGEEWVKTLPLNHENRPVWDVKTLLSLGCSNVHVVTKLPRNLMNEYYATYYDHLPIFMVRAQKG